MKASAYLAALRALPFGDLDSLVGRDPFLVLSPHPDDETLGCGGLLAGAEAAGVPGHVLILTDGAASHPNSPSHPPERLVALRREEARRAIGRLGLPDGRLNFLDLQDAATPSAGPAFDRAVADITRHADAVGARTIFVTWGHDPHCDHETAFAMARRAAQTLGVSLWAYPVWGLHLPPETVVEDPAPRGYRLDIGPYRVVKRHALDSYASQLTRLIDDDPSGFCFTAAQLAPFLGEIETFIAVAS